MAVQRTAPEDMTRAHREAWERQEVEREQALAEVLEHLSSAVNAVVWHSKVRDLAVRQARAAGASWTQIGRAADMSTQGAHRKWREKPER
jgi:hypothetical protein